MYIETIKCQDHFKSGNRKKKKLKDHLQIEKSCNVRYIYPFKCLSRTLRGSVKDQIQTFVLFTHICIVYIQMYICRLRTSTFLPVMCEYITVVRSASAIHKPSLFLSFNLNLSNSTISSEPTSTRRSPNLVLVVAPTQLPYRPTVPWSSTGNTSVIDRDTGCIQHIEDTSESKEWYFFLRH